MDEGVHEDEDVTANVFFGVNLPDKSSVLYLLGRPLGKLAL